MNNEKEAKKYPQYCTDPDTKSTFTSFGEFSALYQQYFSLLFTEGMPSSYQLSW